MRMNSCNLLLIIFTLGTAAYAHVPEVGKIFATFGPFVHQVSSSYVQDSLSSPLAVDFGLLGEGDFNNKDGIEVGIFYGTKTYQRAYANTHLTERINKLSVPLGYRHWFSPAFSTAIAFDANYTMGEAQVIFNNAPKGSEPTTARSITEYGFDFSVQWEPWTQNRFAMLIDARYFYSVSAKSNEDANQATILVGLKYLIQEKSDPSP